MRRCLILYGLTCIFGQVLALREIAVAFQGNEMAYGAALGSWLLLVACGSGAIGRIAEKLNLGLSAFLLSLAGAGVLVPITIVATRAARGWIVGASGITPSFGMALVTTFFLLAPLCLTLGFFYAMACAIAMRTEAEPTQAATRIYVFEAIGTFIGGAIFATVLIHILSAFRIAVTLALMDCLAAAVVWWHSNRAKRPWGWGFFLCAVIAAAVLISPLGTILDFASQALRFPKSGLRESFDTPYGRIDVTRSNGQTEFYESGVFSGTDRMDQTAEEVALIPLLAHPNPRRVLIIGGCLNGVLRKALALPDVTIDYVELDPGLIDAARKHAPQIERDALNSPRVRVFTNIDARRFVRTTRQKYDVILSTAPNPTTDAINRLFTAEFFHEARGALSQNGVLALSIDGSPSYMSEAHRAMVAGVYVALQSAFVQGTAALLPRDNAIALLAVNAPGAIPINGTTMIQRMAQRHVRSAWLTPRMISEITRPEHAAAVLGALSTVNPIRANTDSHPIAYYHAILLWADAFGVPGKSALRVLLRLDLSAVLMGVLVVAALLAFWTTFASRPERVGLPAARVAMGMSGFLIEMVLLFAFQSLFGCAYSYMAVIFAAFMVGLTIGAATAGRCNCTPDEWKVLSLLHVGLAVVAAAVVPALVLLQRGHGNSALWVIPGLNMVVGALVGAHYPLSVAAYLHRGGTTTPAGSAASLYAMDVAGAALGATLGSAVLIPILGLPETSWAVCVISLCALPVLALSARKAS